MYSLSRFGHVWPILTNFLFECRKGVQEGIFPSEGGLQLLRRDTKNFQTHINNEHSYCTYANCIYFVIVATIFTILKYCVVYCNQAFYSIYVTKQFSCTFCEILGAKIGDI